MKNNNIDKSVRGLAAAGVALGMVLAGANVAGAFQLKSERGPRHVAEQPETAMAYANPGFEERFGSAPSGESVDHELNDAWLGMTVTAATGETLGYVTDAIVGTDGEVTDLVISNSSDPDVEVFIPARLATLTDDDVELSLTSQDVAAIRTAYESVMASN